MGTIAGYYFDANPVTHGFVRRTDGTFTTVDAPGGGTGPYQGTFTLSINPAGAITGFTRDAVNGFHGYLRAPDGTFTTFDAGSCTIAFHGTQANNINSRGVITGIYTDCDSVYHGFVRAADGSINTFDAPGAGTSAGQGTIVRTVDCLNDAGATVGE